MEVTNLKIEFMLMPEVVVKNWQENDMFGFNGYFNVQSHLNGRKTSAKTSTFPLKQTLTKKIKKVICNS